MNIVASIVMMVWLVYSKYAKIEYLGRCSYLDGNSLAIDAYISSSLIRIGIEIGIYYAMNTCILVVMAVIVVDNVAIIYHDHPIITKFTYNDNTSSAHMPVTRLSRAPGFAKTRTM